MSDLDKLVDEVTREVRARLEGMPSSGGECQATASECDFAGKCHVRRPTLVRQMRELGAARISATPGHGRPEADIASAIDHTLLKPDASLEELKQVCDEAKQYGFATVCVNSSNIPFVTRHLAGSAVKPIAVVGFPLGAMTSNAKAFETREAIRNGAQEIDMVVNIGALKGREYALVFDDICAVVNAAKATPVKVILETAQLSHDEKVIVCALSKAAGAAFVKTSTGFGGGGATVEDIELMRKIVGPDLGVKASGGMRTAEDVKKMFKAGADRIGASASVAIVTGGQGKTAY